MAQTVGTWVVKSCESDTCLLQALAHISLVFPTAVSPTTTHLTSSWCGCSLSITDNHPFSSNTPTHVPGRLNTRLPPLLPYRRSNGAMSTSDLHRIKDDAARRSCRGPFLKLTMLKFIQIPWISMDLHRMSLKELLKTI